MVESVCEAVAVSVEERITAMRETEVAAVGERMMAMRETEVVTWRETVWREEESRWWDRWSIH